MFAHDCRLNGHKADGFSTLAQAQSKADSNNARFARGAWRGEWRGSYSAHACFCECGRFFTTTMAQDPASIARAKSASLARLARAGFGPVRAAAPAPVRRLPEISEAQIAAARAARRRILDASR